MTTAFTVSYNRIKFGEHHPSVAKAVYTSLFDIVGSFVRHE
jgi:hypothetical protein